MQGSAFQGSGETAILNLAEIVPETPAKHKDRWSATT
jgi:hypothetical protein